jgi:hypothetical protein
VVDQLLVDACAFGNVIDPRAGEASAGEFTPGGRQELLLRGGRIAAPRDWTICASFGHFQPDS